MIYLYTMPGISFNLPSISVPLLKGYLNCNNIKNEQIDTDAIAEANELFLKYLNLFGKYYNITWNRDGLDFGIQIKSIDELLMFAFSECNNMYDCLFDISKNLKGSIYYVSIQYPFQLPYAIRFAKNKARR